MSELVTIKNDLWQFAEPEKAKILQRFFKAIPGGYGEGDRFIGVKVPFQRKIAGKYYKIIPPEETAKLLRDPFHECRLTALFILCLQFEKGSLDEREEIVKLYLQNLPGVNNWDLVDASAHKILGPYLIDQKKELLDDLAQSADIWQQRIAIMATFHFIKNGQYEETLKLAERFLKHEHDLIHKAVGWMLREIGKRDFNTAYAFMQKHYRTMPRTMLRYAIEKFDPRLRKLFLNGEI